MTIKREITAELLHCANEYPVITLIGPRQSGKTTLVKKIFPNHSYVNLENPEIKKIAVNDPKTLFAHFPPPVIFDEIQNVPELLSWIQVVVDDKPDKKAQFILTGSHQMQLRQSVTQSLAGRTALLKLLPFSMFELSDYVNETERSTILLNGFMPRLHDQNIRRERYYQDYYLTYVERDVRKLISIENQNTFELFLRLLAGRVGNEINYSDISNQVGISSVQIKKWISILEASFIIFRLPPYYANFGKRLTKSPKIYFIEVGLAAYLLGIENEQQLERDPAFGGLFENMLIAEALKQRLNAGKDPALYFFRDHHQNEVDLLYTIEGETTAVEIKSSRTYNQEFNKGIRYFQKISKTKNRGLVLYDGDLQISNDTADVINFRNFFTRCK
ncbi:MAG: ATP-binding protein [Spirochaetes bacterium]|nr:ATP-binding protein [Spirochaetota bacterium]MBN2772383.1 ATP-binding protein [Spirochaetota bacterium]